MNDDEDLGFPVELNVYNLSRGFINESVLGKPTFVPPRIIISSPTLASLFHFPNFLGRPVEGIWYTGIVSYGREYLFSRAGVESCRQVRHVHGLLQVCKQGPIGIALKPKNLCS